MSIVVFLIAFIVRSYKLHNLFPFTFQEEYQAFLVRKITLFHDLPLIGVNVADTGFYLGSFFTWLSAIPYLIFHSNPIGTAWTAVLFGATAAVLVAFIVNAVTKDRAVGVIAGILYAVNPLINAWDRKWWNPSLVPLLVLVLMYALLSVKKNRWWLPVIGAVFGMAFHTHYSLLPLLIPTLWWLKREKVRLSFPLKKSPKDLLKSQVFLTLAVFTLFIAPIVLFEVTHSFIQTKKFSQFITQSHSSSSAFESKLVTVYQGLNRFVWFGFGKDLSSEISVCDSASKTTSNIPAVILLAVAVGGVFCIRKIVPAIQLLFLSSAMVIVSLLLYPGKIEEYYLLPLFPLLILLAALFFWRLLVLLPGKKEFIVGIGLAVVLITWSLQSLTFTNSLGLAKKEKVLQYIQHWVGSNQYELYSLGACYKWEGYRYLTESLDFPPVVSYMDGYLSWLYGNKLEQFYPAFEVAIVDKRELSQDTVQAEWEGWQKRYGQYNIQTDIDGLGIIIVKRM